MDNPPACSCDSPESCSCWLSTSYNTTVNHGVTQASHSEPQPSPAPRTQFYSPSPYVWPTISYSAGPQMDMQNAASHYTYPYNSGWHVNAGWQPPHHPVAPPLPPTLQAAPSANTTQLANVTSTIVNSTPPLPTSTGNTCLASSQSAPKRVRNTQGSKNSGNAKRRKGNRSKNTENQPPTTVTVASVPSVAVHGAGPINPPLPFISPPAVLQSYGSVAAKPTHAPKSDATHVWFFVRGLSNREIGQAPPLAPPSMKQPSTAEFPVLGCRLCTSVTSIVCLQFYWLFLGYSYPKWTTWKNCDGQTKTIRNHLESAHQLLWEELVIVYKLKGWETIQEQQKVDTNGRKRSYEPFTLAGFNERLLSFIAANDKVHFLLDFYDAYLQQTDAYFSVSWNCWQWGVSWTSWIYMPRTSRIWGNPSSHQTQWNGDWNIPKAVPIFGL